jgi:hypothetical protein
VLLTLQAEDVNTPEYRALHNTLYRFEENIELAYIYTVRAQEDGSFVFTIDPDPEAPGAFGEHIPYTEALYNASLGTPGVDDEAYVDQWGRFYSAYSPVFTSTGEVAGIVAVDFTADWYDRQLSNQMKATVSISGISIIVASIIVILIVSRYKKRFDRLFQGMNLISEGIETLVREISPDAKPEEQPEENTSGADEIDRLNSRIFSLQEKLGKQIQWVRSRAYIDGLTGLVYFATDKGICSYLSDATTPADELSKDNVLAYPNPVSPDYTGPIAIKGLVADSEVKILSSSGRLIWTGHSNGGMATWDCCGDNGERVKTGVYYVMASQAQGGKQASVTKLVIIK